MSICPKCGHGYDVTPEGIKLCQCDAVMPKVVIVQDTDTLNAMLNLAMQEVEHEHEWRDTGFANLDDCALCGITRPHPEEGPPA